MMFSDTAFVLQYVLEETLGIIIVFSLRLLIIRPLQENVINVHFIKGRCFRLNGRDVRGQIKPSLITRHSKTLGGIALSLQYVVVENLGIRKLCDLPL